jgi:hypothetical protein
VMARKREFLVIRTTDLAGVIEELVIPDLTDSELINLSGDGPIWNEHGFEPADFTNPAIYAKVETCWRTR